MAREKETNKEDRIFEAALRIVVQQGFAGLKMSEVAKKAGVATGTLYLYFETKEDLIDKLYRSYKQANYEALLAGYDTAGSFAERFKQLWYNYFNACFKDPLRMIFIEQYYRSPYLREETKKETGLLGQPVIDLLTEGIQEKTLRSLPVELLIAQIISPIHELVKLHFDKRLALTKPLVEQCFAMCWDSVRS